MMNGNSGPTDGQGNPICMHEDSHVVPVRKIVPALGTDKDEKQQQIDDLKYLLRRTANGLESLARVVASLPGVDQASATEAGAIAEHVREAHMQHYTFRTELSVARARRARRYLNRFADMEGAPRPFEEVDE